MHILTRKKDQLINAIGIRTAIRKSVRFEGFPSGELTDAMLFVVFFGLIVVF